MIRLNTQETESLPAPNPNSAAWRRFKRLQRCRTCGSRRRGERISCQEHSSMKATDPSRHKSVCSCDFPDIKDLSNQVCSPSKKFRKLDSSSFLIVNCDAPDIKDLSNQVCSPSKVNAMFPPRLNPLSCFGNDGSGACSFTGTERGTSQKQKSRIADASENGFKNPHSQKTLRPHLSIIASRSHNFRTRPDADNETPTKLQIAVSMSEDCFERGSFSTSFEKQLDRSEHLQPSDNNQSDISSGLHCCSAENEQRSTVSDLTSTNWTADRETTTSYEDEASEISPGSFSEKDCSSDVHGDLDLKGQAESEKHEPKKLKRAQPCPMSARAATAIKFSFLETSCSTDLHAY